MDSCVIVFRVNIEFRVPYSQRYLFNATGIPDTNHNANPTNPTNSSIDMLCLYIQQSLFDLLQNSINELLLLLLTLLTRILYTVVNMAL